MKLCQCFNGLKVLSILIYFSVFTYRHCNDKQMYDQWYRKQYIQAEHTAHEHVHTECKEIHNQPVAVSSSILQVLISCEEEELVDPHTCSQFSLWTGSQAWCPALSPQNPPELIWPDRGRGEWWKPRAIVAQLGSTSPRHTHSWSERGISCFAASQQQTWCQGVMFSLSGWVMEFVLEAGDPYEITVASWDSSWTPPLAAFGFGAALLL